jgi:hypothetical protein
VHDYLPTVDKLDSERTSNARRASSDESKVTSFVGHGCCIGKRKRDRRTREYLFAVFAAVRQQDERVIALNSTPLHFFSALRFLGKHYSVKVGRYIRSG